MALQYGASIGITITAGSLATGANRSSASVTTGTADNIFQILLTVICGTTGVAPTGQKQIIVYGYKSEDGSTYNGNGSTTDNVDGTDKVLTAIGSPTALTLLGTIPINQGAVSTPSRGVFEVTGTLGGIFPKWGIVLFNDAGTALGAAVTASYREVYYT